MTSFSISTTGSAQTEKLGSSRDRTQDHGMLRFTTVPSIDRGICNDTPPWAVILGFVQYVCYMEKCLVVALGSMSHTLCSSIYHLLTLWPLSEPIRASKVAVPGPEWRCQALSGGARPWVAVPGPEWRCRALSRTEVGVDTEKLILWTTWKRSNLTKQLVFPENEKELREFSPLRFIEKKVKTNHLRQLPLKFHRKFRERYVFVIPVKCVIITLLCCKSRNIPVVSLVKFFEVCKLHF